MKICFTGQPGSSWAPGLASFQSKLFDWDQLQANWRICVVRQQAVWRISGEIWVVLVLLSHQQMTDAFSDPGLLFVQVRLARLSEDWNVVSASSPPQFGAVAARREPRTWAWLDIRRKCTLPLRQCRASFVLQLTTADVHDRVAPAGSERRNRNSRCVSSLRRPHAGYWLSKSRVCDYSLE